MGPPDLIVRMSVPFRLAAEGNEVCPNFVLPLHLTKDRWVRAVDVRPSNPRVVRAVSLFVDASGRARRLAAESGAGGYYAFSAGLHNVAQRFSDWAPGGVVHTLPADCAMCLKRADDLVMMLRCQPTGEEEEEQTEVGLYFAPHAPRRTPITAALGAAEIYLLANQTLTVTDALPLPVGVQAVRIVPHAGLYCRTLTVTANLPNGSARTLLRITAWDPHWAEPYQWVSPVTLPAGTRLALTATYDNTTANPLNANHPLMSTQPSTEFMDESAGVQIQILAEHPAEEATLGRVLQNPTDNLKLEKRGGEGHG